jgi:hypothetical protein
LNDSIKSGLKPVTDPNDFELVDMVGHWNGIRWEVTGTYYHGRTRMERKPQYWKGYLCQVFRVHLVKQPKNQNGFIMKQDWAAASGIMTSGAIGHHSFDPVFDYVSTVSSLYIK